MPDVALLIAAQQDFLVIFSSSFVGISVGLGAYFGRPYYWAMIDYLEKDFTVTLRRLRVSTAAVRRSLVIWSCAIVVILLSLWLLADSLVFAILSAVLLFCFPWFIVHRMADKHRQKLEDQLADSMVLLSSGIKAGLSLAQAVEMLADQSPHPINAEFAQIIREYNMGKPLDRTLEEAKQRLRSENFALFAAALLASRESGGRLNETVDRIAHSVRELQRLERKVTSETAMARKSAVYMALAPLFILVAYFFVDAEAVRALFGTPTGQLILSAAIVLNVVAFLWARVILNPDI